MNIHSLLNPLCGEPHGFRSSASPAQAPVPYSRPPTVMPKRLKVAKDAPIFSEGNKIVGNVNYPPYEAEHDQDLTAQHQSFQVYPLGEIYRKGVRHIPYNSDKKDFQDKTGREAFEMFQYTYKRPGEEKEYVVVWDYNVGLVRMTPFFKSCKYSKTIPAKALRENPGLKDISYSITGGALVCQGYWMPYQAAKAVAATFCYDIRWALTPVFGKDFPSLCLHPKDPGFAKFLIDPAIVQFCTAETTRFRKEGPYYSISTTDMSQPAKTVKMEMESPPRQPRALTRRVRPTDIESGYGTDTDQSDKWAFSPQVSPRSQWTPVNRSLSPCSPRTTTSSATSSPVGMQPVPYIQMPTSVPCGYYTGNFRRKRTHSKVGFGDDYDEEMAPRPQTAGTIHGDGVMDFQIGGDTGRTQTDISAAELLLSLGWGEQQVLSPPTKRTRRGSTM